jgi:hypothetical protein
LDPLQPWMSSAETVSADSLMLSVTLQPGIEPCTVVGEVALLACAPVIIATVPAMPMRMLRNGTKRKRHCWFCGLLPKPIVPVLSGGKVPIAAY